MSKIPLNSSYVQSALIVLLTDQIREDVRSSPLLPQEHFQPAHYAIVSNFVVPSFGAFFIR